MIHEGIAESDLPWAEHQENVKKGRVQDPGEARWS